MSLPLFNSLSSIQQGSLQLNCICGNSPSITPKKKSSKKLFAEVFTVFKHFRECLLHNRVKMEKDKDPGVVNLYIYT